MINGGKSRLNYTEQFVMEYGIKFGIKDSDRTRLTVLSGIIRPDYIDSSYLEVDALKKMFPSKDVFVGDTYEKMNLSAKEPFFSYDEEIYFWDLQRCLDLSNTPYFRVEINNFSKDAKTNHQLAKYFIRNIEKILSKITTPMLIQNTSKINFRGTYSPCLPETIREIVSHTGVGISLNLSDVRDSAKEMGIRWQDYLWDLPDMSLKQLIIPKTGLLDREDLEIINFCLGISRPTMITLDCTGDIQSMLSNYLELISLVEVHPDHGNKIIIPLDLFRKTANQE